MKIYAADRSELMQVTKVERQGDNLVLKGKVFGTMKLAWFLLTLPFRKGGK